MSHSHRITFESIRAALRLVREVCELGDDPVAWRQHMLSGLTRLCEAYQATSTLISLSLDPGQAQSISEVLCGFDDAATTAYRDYIANGDPCPDPMNSSIMAHFRTPFTTRRQKAVKDREWYESAYFNEVCRPMRSGPQLVSIQPTPKMATVMAIGLTRPLDGRLFRACDGQLLHIFHEELALVMRTPQLGSNPLAKLSPRQRQIITLLRSGNGEKQIASHLSLSRHTVHSYIRNLYRRFDASSQTELLAAVKPKAEFRPKL
jgi:DNA-binding CsgD family transcriptional regulator